MEKKHRAFIEAKTTRVAFVRCSVCNARSGRYKLEETKAPAGYIIAESAWYMNVDTSGKATFENTQAAPSTLVSVKTDKSNEFWVENEPGAALPKSGGPGTTWMYIFGMLLTVAAGGALVVRRRMQAAE